MSISYNDWLKMTPEEQNHIHFDEWNVYERDGYPIALMAAARFTEQSPKKIYDCSIGTYHGGEYVLHMYVSDEDFPSCPKKFEQSFEGFRILWQPIGPLRSDLEQSPK